MSRYRIRCKLIGCDTGNDCICWRCGDHLYYTAVQRGLLWPIQWRLERLKRISHKLRHAGCEECGKPIPLRRRLKDEYLCSQECWEKHLPF
jgi:hypothetical protein